MKTLAELRDDLRELRDEAKAIVDKATAENREPTAQEQARLDELLGAGETRGVIADRAAEIDRLERFENRMTLADQATRANRPVQPQTATPSTLETQRPRIVIPAQARRTGTLTAFKGAEAERDAYVSGMWLFAALFKSPQAHQFCCDHGIPIRMALSGSTDSLGGYTVPDEMERAIIDLREERGVFRRNARREPMMSDIKRIPRRTGGPTLYYVADNTEITASNVTWDQVTLTARKAGAMVLVSSELNEDSVISIADTVTREIAYAMANGEDLAGFNGDGTSTYGGMTGLKNALAAGSKVTAATGNTAFSTLDLDDFENMIGKCPLYAVQDDPAWYISRAGWAASMLRLAAAAGGNTMDNIAGAMQPTFLGYPVRFSQVMNSTLTAQTSTDGLAYFGSLRQGVAFGDRRGVSIMLSEHRYFELDQLAIKGTERFDIVVHEKGTASVAGSIVMLSTPGS